MPYGSQGLIHLHDSAIGCLPYWLVSTGVVYKIPVTWGIEMR